MRGQVLTLKCVSKRVKFATSLWCFFVVFLGFFFKNYNLIFVDSCYGNIVYWYVVLVRSRKKARY